MLALQNAPSDSVGQESQGLNTLTTQEQDTLKDLLDPNVTIDVAIPNSVDHSVLYRNLATCIKAVNYLGYTERRIKPLIGRMLKLIQDQPDFYRGIGYRTFDDFLVKGVQEKLGFSRSNLYECKQIAEKWPSLTVEQYARIGATKLTILSKFTREGEPMANRMLAKAEKLSVAKLRGWATEKNLIEQGETEAAVIVIETNRAIANEWAEMLNNALVIQHVESDKPGEIFRAMMGEAKSTWFPETQG